MPQPRYTQPSVADVFRRYGPAYRQRYQESMLPSHIAAMEAIETCRTEAQGGHIYLCTSCGEIVYSYHSCKNRHCPTCQHNETEKWVAERTKQLVPATYFLVTFTLPSQLRGVARSNQKVVYSLMFQAAAQALQALANDPRFIGGRLGMVAVLHTWTKKLNYHPHIHILVPGIAIAPDQQSWVSTKKPNYLVPGPALAKIFSAKMADGLNKAGIIQNALKGGWKKQWVVDCKPVGSGKQALIYLAQYVHRTAVSNNRILSMEGGKITVACRESASDNDPKVAKAKYVEITLAPNEFIRRVLQHVLPKSFVRIRYYGFLSPSWRKPFAALKQLLEDSQDRDTQEEKSKALDENNDEKSDQEPPIRTCPSCGQPLTFYMIITRRDRAPP